MENNSIRDNLTKEDIISDIRMCIGADVYKEKVFVVVEGKDDIRFIRSFVSDNVELYESYSGKTGIEYIVGDFFAGNDNVIGIRDRDYCTGTCLPKIFFYDNCNMEMMIIKTDEVFERICFEYYEGKMTARQLRENLLKELKYLSIIRKHNEEEKWYQNFKCISISSLFDPQKKKLDKDSIIQQLNICNEDFFNEEILRKIESDYSEDWTEEEYYNNTRGHDFFALLFSVCRIYRKKGMRYAELESCGRCAYRWQDFVKTELSNSLRKYERKKQLKIIKPELFTV